MAIVIDVPGMGPTLFSPVFAHALEPGDLFHAEGVTARATSVRRTGHGHRVVSIGCNVVSIGENTVASEASADRYGAFLNERVLRAVGARAGGVR